MEPEVGVSIGPPKHNRTCNVCYGPSAYELRFAGEGHNIIVSLCEFCASSTARALKGRRQ